MRLELFPYLCRMKVPAFGSELDNWACCFVKGNDSAKNLMISIWWNTEIDFMVRSFSSNNFTLSQRVWVSFWKHLAEASFIQGLKLTKRLANHMTDFGQWRNRSKETYSKWLQQMQTVIFKRASESSWWWNYKTISGLDGRIIVAAAASNLLVFSRFLMQPGDRTSRCFRLTDIENTPVQLSLEKIVIG